MAAYPGKSSLAAYRAVAAHGGVAAADPHQLIVLLMDGALDRIGAARGAMEHGESQSSNRFIHRAVEIVQELSASLNMQAGGELAANLAALYDYSSRQLVRANIENRPELLEEVGKLLRQIRSAWIQIPAQPGARP